MVQDGCYRVDFKDVTFRANVFGVAVRVQLTRFMKWYVLDMYHNENSVMYGTLLNEGDGVLLFSTNNAETPQIRVMPTGDNGELGIEMPEKFERYISKFTV